MAALRGGISSGALCVGRATELGFRELECLQHLPAVWAAGLFFNVGALRKWLYSR